jgi:pyridoxamine 5'-phosphate oxidase
MTDTTINKTSSSLTSGDFTAAEEPFALFSEWLNEAFKSEPADGNAMTLATVDKDGMPDARMVLLKGFDADGFVFYSHIDSAKGRELTDRPKAALVFHWKSLRRQVRIRGIVETVTAEEADAYFATRPKQAQLGAWASKQSQPLESRFAFEQQIAKYAAKHMIGDVRGGRRAGAAGASCRCRSNSGTTGPIACTTASFSPARPQRTRGPRRASIHDRNPLAQCRRATPTFRAGPCF